MRGAGLRAAAGTLGAGSMDNVRLAFIQLILRSAGLLSMEKRGLKVFYRLSCPCFLDFLNCVDRMSSSTSSSTSCSTPG